MFNIFAVFVALFALVTKEEQECDGACKSSFKEVFLMLLVQTALQHRHSVLPVQISQIEILPTTCTVL
jgi:hypothetical protein